MKYFSYQHVVLVSSGRLCRTDVDVFTGEYMFKLKANTKENSSYFLIIFQNYKCSFSV